MTFSMPTSKFGRIKWNIHQQNDQGHQITDDPFSFSCFLKIRKPFQSFFFSNLYSTPLEKFFVFQRSKSLKSFEKHLISCNGHSSQSLLLFINGLPANIRSNIIFFKSWIGRQLVECAC